MLSQEGDRTTDTEDVVMRTPEFKDKNFHFQKFLGRKQEFGLWVKDLLIRVLTSGWT